MVNKLCLFYIPILQKTLGDDHIILEFSIMQAKATEHSQISFLDFKRAYFNKLREITKDSMDGNPRRSIQDAWETLKNKILKAQTKTIPQRKKNKRNQMRPTWSHKELCNKLMNKKDKYKKNEKKGTCS